MIITLAQVKSLLNIQNTSKDPLIGVLIPEVEAKYLQIRNIPFMQILADTNSGDKTISNIRIYPEQVLYGYNSSAASYLNRLEYLYSSAIDNYITDIDSNNNTVEIDTAASATAKDVVFTVYPQGSKMVAAKLVQYLMNSNSMNGLSSETVGSYSWSKGDNSNPFGVPNDIFKSITRYINA